MAKKVTKKDTGETPEIEDNRDEEIAVTEQEAPAMTPEQIEEAMSKANFSIQEEPEKPTAVPPALMFDDDTKVTPALIMQRMKEQAAQRATQAASENKGPREEIRANGRRVIRHN